MTSPNNSESGRSVSSTTTSCRVWSCAASDSSLSVVVRSVSYSCPTWVKRYERAMSAAPLRTLKQTTVIVGPSQRSWTSMM